jgi:hypothetical protein
MNMFIETINHTSFWRRSTEDPKTKSSIRQQGGQADFFLREVKLNFRQEKDVHRHVQWPRHPKKSNYLSKKKIGANISPKKEKTGAIKRTHKPITCPYMWAPHPYYRNYPHFSFSTQGLKQIL